MDMEISVPGSGFGEDGMSVASVEVVAGAKVRVFLDDLFRLLCVKNEMQRFIL